MNELRAVDFVSHIREAATEALSFVEGMTKAEFLADARTQKAVEMDLLVIGEASAKVMDAYPEYVALHAHVPWRVMRGMRNRIAHGYFDINLDVVWDTVQAALPQLLAALPASTNEPDK